jgi:Transcription factor WhiB
MTPLRRSRRARRYGSAELAQRARVAARKAARATELAGCLASGLSPGEAASAIGVSERTVQRFIVKEGPEMTGPATPSRRHRTSLGWMDLMACKDTDIHNGPEDEHPARQKARVTKAKAVCASCSVIAECLAYGLEKDIRHGVLGGLDEAERRELRHGVAA